MASVTLTNLVKKYGSTQVVHGINLEIKDKEFIVLVGPSGCGKSTTLRMVAGLEDVSNGEIRIGERVVNNVPPKDRNVAMVFQNYALYPHMTVYENMAFGLRMRKLPKEEIHEKVMRAAKVLGLEPYLGRKPAALSGGQRQRVAMGRTIVKEVEVFLFDEPLSNLDAKLRSEMRLEIKQRHHELKTTSIYVTHDQLEAMTLADRIVIMKDGHIIQIGTPLEVFENPINLFVASFIGTPGMNHLKMKIENKDGAILMVDDTGQLKLPLPANKKFPVTDGQEVILGIRPSDIFISTNEDHIPNEWKANGFVVVSELLGKNALLTLKIGHQTFIGEIMGRSMPKMKETVLLSFNLNHMHLFDPVTTMSFKAI